MKKGMMRKQTMVSNMQGYVEVDGLFGEACFDLDCTPEKWKSMSEDEQHECLMSAFWEAGIVDVYVEESEKMTEKTLSERYNDARVQYEEKK